MTIISAQAVKHYLWILLKTFSLYVKANKISK